MVNQTAPTIEESAGQITFTRVFNAPRELVFKAYSECEHLMNWWGPRSWPLTFCEMDFRPGGVWRYCMTGPDGEEAWGMATYREIVAPERIVYIDAFSDADGNVNADLPQAVATIELAERDGKTTLTSRAKYPSKESLQAVLEMGMVEGLNETLDRLDEHLANIQRK